jgi:hypothetical protein
VKHLEEEDPLTRRPDPHQASAELTGCRTETGINLKDLIQAADITLYRAKAADRARYAMFDITAEGGATPTQLKRFPAVGYDPGQGPLSGLPCTAEQIDALIRAATGLLCELSAQES